MGRQSQRIQFETSVHSDLGKSESLRLSGILEIPEQSPRGSILFSHCFTCNKDLKAIVRISRELAELGWLVLRYDFRGLGNSEGVFSHSNFSTNCIDLESAYSFLSSQFPGAIALIGHSFGGAASLAMAQTLEQVRAVIAIAAPSDTHHLAALLTKMDPEILSRGTGHVVIGGFKYEINKQMIDDFLSVDLPKVIQQLNKPMLALHSTQDETVGYWHAVKNCDFDNALSRPFAPRSLVSLPGSNHLLTEGTHCKSVAETIDGWLTYLI